MRFKALFYLVDKQFPVSLAARFQRNITVSRDLTSYAS